MGAVYHSICFEADTLTLLVTRLIEKEIQLKLDIEKLMNDGFVHIAKARYIMGSTCVRKMQLPTGDSNPIQPLATVCRVESNNKTVYQIIRKPPSRVCSLKSKGGEDEVENDSKSSESSMSRISKSDAAFTDLKLNNPKSFKKSTKAYSVEDDLYQEYNDELLDEISSSDSNESSVSIKDPIRLFGILVPNALKEAQFVFNKIVDLLGDCATVQLELREALDKFCHLEQVKKLIEAASKETKTDILMPKLYWTPSERSIASSKTLKSEEEEQESEEEESKSEESSAFSEISIKKSIRSVFYELSDTEVQGQELSFWGSGMSVHLNNN